MFLSFTFLVSGNKLLLYIDNSLLPIYCSFLQTNLHAIQEIVSTLRAILANRAILAKTSTVYERRPTSLQLPRRK